MPDSKGLQGLLAVLVVGAVMLGGCSEPPSRLTPQEQHEPEQSRSIAETACALWGDGALDLPEHQAQVCTDGDYEPSQPQSEQSSDEQLDVHVEMLRAEAIANGTAVECLIEYVEYRTEPTYRSDWSTFVSKVGCPPDAPNAKMADVQQDQQCHRSEGRRLPEGVRPMCAHSGIN